MKKGFLDQRWPWLLAAGAIVLAFLVTSFEIRMDGFDARETGSASDIVALGERSDTNLLFLLLDTLRADHLGSYGYERSTSPMLDQLAASGVRFDRHLAQSSWTKASMASLWAALNPARTGITRYDHVIPEQARMPAEILKEAGFVTAGIFRNGWVASTFGFQQGFDVYTRPHPGPLPPDVAVKNPTITERGTDEDALGSAIEFLRIHGQERWFIYLHLMDVHEYLYDEQSAVFGGSYADIYDNSILRLDALIGVLLAHLADMGLAEKTIVAVASDHGEAFLERGYEGHARALFRETTEVPFLLSFPFRLEPGVVVRSRTRNIDVWPTLLDLVGLSMPEGLDGRSLKPEILAAVADDPSADGDLPAMAHLDRNWGRRDKPENLSVSIVDGSLRYVRLPGGQVEQLFDAEEDPAELRDRAAEDPESLARLRSAADAYLETPPAWGEAPRREINELELNQLRALGYALP
jgi:arylsulfatase A-like enzyme